MGRESLFSPDTWCQLHHFCNILEENPLGSRDRAQKSPDPKVFICLGTRGWKGKVPVAQPCSWMLLLPLRSVDSNTSILRIHSVTKAPTCPNREAEVRKCQTAALAGVALRL